MQVNDRDLVERLEYSTGHPYQIFSFHLSKSSDDILYINPVTEDVNIKYSRQEHFVTGTNLGSYIGQTPTPTSYSGTWYQGISISCNSCCQYSYTLRLHVDLTEGKLAGTYLNSEQISVEEGNTVHEVRNVYAVEKTEYACFPKDGSSKKSSIPLVPLNLLNPKETITRIRKLLIFS
jgi:hypothetical protein